MGWMCSQSVCAIQKCLDEFAPYLENEGDEKTGAALSSEVTPTSPPEDFHEDVRNEDNLQLALVEQGASEVASEHGEEPSVEEVPSELSEGELPPFMKPKCKSKAQSPTGSSAKKIEQDDKKIEQDDKKIEQDDKKIEQRDKKIELDDKKTEQDDKKSKKDDKKKAKKSKKDDKKKAKKSKKDDKKNDKKSKKDDKKNDKKSKGKKKEKSVMEKKLHSVPCHAKVYSSAWTKARGEGHPGDEVRAIATAARQQCLVRYTCCYIIFYLSSHVKYL